MPLVVEAYRGSAQGGEARQFHEPVFDQHTVRQPDEWDCTWFDSHRDSLVGDRGLYERRRLDRGQFVPCRAPESESVPEPRKYRELEHGLVGGNLEI